jgi:transcription initiation factor TFIIIB Brf1 subunit/transcription initiation factor TFIIB
MTSIAISADDDISCVYKDKNNDTNVCSSSGAKCSKRLALYGPEGRAAVQHRRASWAAAKGSLHHSVSLEGLHTFT